LNTETPSSQFKDFGAVNFDYIPYINGNYDTFASQSDTSTRDGVYINSIEEQVYISNAPNLIFKGALLKQGDSDFVSVGLFYDGQEFLNEVDGLNHLAPYGQHRVQAYHNQFRNANEIYRMTCQGLGAGEVDGDGYDDHQDLIHRIFNRDIEPSTNNRAFQLVNQDVDLRNCEWTGTMIQNFDQDIGFVTDDYVFQYETPSGQVTHHGNIPGEEPAVESGSGSGSGSGAGPCVTLYYVANLTQSGTDNPIVRVFEDTIGGITWMRDSQGSYIGAANITGIFTSHNTWWQLNNTMVEDEGISTSLAIVRALVADESTIVVVTKRNTLSGDDFADGLLNNASLEIRVYCPPENCPIANAGIDQTICNTDGSVSLSGSIDGDYDTFVWSTSGDGSFDDDSILNPVYTPGATDISNGVVTLTIIASLTGCDDSSDSVDITIDPDAIATFDYTVPNASTLYCQCLPSNPVCVGNPISPNFTGGGIAGEFTCSDPNLIFFDGSPSPTGQVDIELTPPGTYTVTNTVNNSCGSDVQTSDITILALPVTTFTWSTDNVMTQGEGLVNVVKTGSSVIADYTCADAGLIINETSGQIDAGASTPGTYDIYIVYGAACTNSTTVTVTINP